MNILLIGCGNMGSAIVHRLAQQGHQITVHDKNIEIARDLAYGIHAEVYEQIPLTDKFDFILLAIKPQDFHTISDELYRYENLFIVSVATGKTIAELKASFPKCHVLRLMPNLAVRYGHGVVALSEDPALDMYKKQIEELFSPLGALFWLDENKFDGVTALTGSGAAFFYTMVEAMVDAAIEIGFSAEIGFDLVKKMVDGALTMLDETKAFPCELKWKISSPGGTTIEGLRTLEKCNLRSAVIETFVAARDKAKHLKKDPTY